MGSRNAAARMPIAPETGAEPHFHVTDAVYEIQVDGTIRVSIYEEVHGELVLRCTATVMPGNLERMSRKSGYAAAEARSQLTFLTILDGGNAH